MNNKDIFKAIGEVGGDLVDELEATPKKPMRFMRYLAIAACLCIVASAALLSQIERYPKKLVAPPSETSLSEIALIPRWDEMPIYQQFSRLPLGIGEYSGHSAIVPSQLLGERLGESTLTGYDEYEDKTYTAQCEYYSVEGVSSQCAVAVRFDGADESYIYCNSYYRPETLGQFIDDLSLHENLFFGTVYYDYVKLGGERVSVEFTGLDAQYVWDVLLSAREAENVYEDSRRFDTVMSISIDLPLFGYKNISLSVTEDGYLVTNILDTGKAFYIGTDKTEAFIAHVKKNCDGFEIQYDTSGEEVPE